VRCAADIARQGTAEAVAPLYEAAVVLAELPASGCQESAVGLLNAIVRVIGTDRFPYFQDLFELALGELVHLELSPGLELLGTISELTNNQDFVQRTVAGVLTRLGQTADAAMQRAAVQCVASLAKCDITAEFHEFVGRLLAIVDSTDDLDLFYHCLEALSALFVHHQQLMLPHCPYLIQIVDRVLSSFEKLAENDEEDILLALVTVAIKLDKFMLMALPPDLTPQCLEIAVKAVSQLPQMPLPCVRNE
jgi:hypothetical protein